MTTPDASDQRPHAYAIWGMHGGYFLTGVKAFEEALTITEECLHKHPDLKYLMEIESFTLDRFVRGPQLRVEEKHRPGNWNQPELAARLRSLAQQGRIDNVSSYTQTIFHALDGEAVIRQFGFSRRLQKEILGIELDYYATQEPCWCGQLPAILSGFNMKGCSFETSWGPYGFAGLIDGESFTWRGPDGSEIRMVAATPAMRDTHLDREKEAAGRHIMAWQNPYYNKLNATSIKEAVLQGMDHPLQICLSLDFTSGRPAEYFDPCKLVNGDCNITFTTIGPYLAQARNDGILDDVFTKFEDRLCWGVEGGKLYLDSQIAANKTILSQRLSVLQGFDHREEEYRMWQGTMISQHHDCWFGSACMFGQFHYDSYGALIDACRQEVEQRADHLFAIPQGPAFYITNPTQKPRQEWTVIDIPLIEGAINGQPAIQDSADQPVPCRIHAIEQHPDGSVARIQGFMLSAVPGFGSTSYNVTSLEQTTPLPTRVTHTQNAWEISNDTLKAVLSPDGIRLYRDGIECVSNLHLHANVDRWDDTSNIRNIHATLQESGVAYACASGILGCIPFEIEITIKPWSARFDIHVRCNYNGENTESTNYWEQDGNLKLVASYPDTVSHLLHQPFELRSPDSGTHSAVHFVLADQADNSGCALILDRPSGVVSDDQSTGIVLCHSGWTLCHNQTRPDVKGTNAYRYTNSRVYGWMEYDVSLLPYGPDSRADAVFGYQHQAYPLQITSGQLGPLSIPRINLQANCIVSNLSREENGIILRLWNPFEQETVKLEVPDMQLSLVDFEDNELKDLGTESASFTIGPMQIRTILLQPTP